MILCTSPSAQSLKSGWIRIKSKSVAYKALTSARSYTSRQYFGTTWVNMVHGLISSFRSRIANKSMLLSDQISSEPKVKISVMLGCFERPLVGLRSVTWGKRVTKFEMKVKI